MKGQRPQKERHIFVVDDDPDSPRLTENILGGRGLLLSLISNATQLESKAEQFQPELIILDIMMPQMSGFEMCRALRANESTRQFLIMAVTTLTRHDVRRIYECGVDDYLAAPFKVDQLLEKLAPC